MSSRKIISERFPSDMHYTVERYYGYWEHSLSTDSLEEAKEVQTDNIRDGYKSRIIDNRDKVET